MYKSYCERFAAFLSPKEQAIFNRLIRRVATKRDAIERASKKLRAAQLSAAAKLRLQKRRDETAAQSPAQRKDMIAWMDKQKTPFTRRSVELARSKIFSSPPSRDRLRVLFDEWVKEG